MNTQSLWFEFVTFIFFWGGVVAAILGLLLLAVPAAVLRAGAVLNRWVSTERVFRKLDSPRSSERMFYRHHRVFGLLLVLGALYLLYSFGVRLDPAELAGKLILFRSRAASEWLFQSLAAVNVIFGSVALVMGTAVFFRPSALKSIEAATNRWFRVDDSFKRLDAQVQGPDLWAARRPRLLGALIVAGGVYVAFSLYAFIR